MARTMPVHAGYSILNGNGTGPHGDRLQVWVEYLVGRVDTARNRTWLTAWFYAALDPHYTANAQNGAGLDARFTVDGVLVDSVTNGAYNFTSAESVNLLGSFSGWVNHGTDGTKELTLQGQFTTASYEITGGSVSGVVTLPTVMHPANPYAEDVQLGNACRVRWVPAQAGHSFTLTFSLGQWQQTTSRIYPVTNRAFTYTGLVLPLEVARQFAGPFETMTVELSTYAGDELVGQASDSFRVTVPKNAQTCPVVSATLQPDCAPFPGRYVQNLSKVSAQVTAEDPLGAQITQYTIRAGGNVVNGTLSDYLSGSGNVAVTVTARNSRGFEGVFQSQIQVIPYEPPRILRAGAYRCLSDGTADPGGNHLRLEADWWHSPVEGENSCGFRWRYQATGDSWSPWENLSAADGIDTGAIAGVVSGSNTAYTVQLEVVDAAGGTAREQFSIPVEQVYMHRTKNAMGLGGYVRDPETLEIHWDLSARKSINGAYLRAVSLTDTRSFAVQSRFPALDGPGDQYQLIRLFGCAGGQLIQGFALLSNNGETQWDGSAGVTVSADGATGILTVTLPGEATGRFALLSPDPIG